MDAHTARCLQLSTNIQMPFNGGYRPAQFDARSRSRFPVSQQQQQQQQQKGAVRPQNRRSSSVPAVSWRPSNTGSTPTSAHPMFRQPSFGPASTIKNQSMSTVSPMTHTPSQSFDQNTMLSSSNTSPETPLGESWDPNFGIDAKVMNKDALGMNFLDMENNFSADPFGASNDGLDLIHLNENDTIDFNSKPMSPDRHSLSSTSENDHVSDFPAEAQDGSMMPTLNSDVAMATVEEDEPVDFSRARHSRSSSRAPAARSSSNRRYRNVPYSFSGHRRSSSVFSTASSVSGPAGYQNSMPSTRCCSPVGENAQQMAFGLETFENLDFGNEANIFGEEMFANPQMIGGFPADGLMAPKPMASVEGFLFNPHIEENLFEAPAHILPSSEVPSTEQRVDEFADCAEEPDLFSALHEEQSVPSEEDMNPEDKDMTPQEQDVRFEGDLYTPRFVRGHGNKREGYCGLCKPGRWLVLKNSAYWYDKSFTHGISAATGQPFEGPRQTRRMSGNPDVWEGLCGHCNEWIALISNKKKGTTWFRHAYKCHSQNKKDNKKRRAESVAPANKHARQESVSTSPATQIKQEQPQHPQMPQQQPQQMVQPQEVGNYFLQ